MKENDALLDLECTIKEAHEEPDDSRLIACSVHDPLSGQLIDFDYTEMANIDKSNENKVVIQSNEMDLKDIESML